MFSVSFILLVARSPGLVNCISMRLSSLDFIMNLDGTLKLSYQDVLQCSVLAHLADMLDGLSRTLAVAAPARRREVDDGVDARQLLADEEEERC